MQLRKLHGPQGLHVQEAEKQRGTAYNNMPSICNHGCPVRTPFRASGPKLGQKLSKKWPFSLFFWPFFAHFSGGAKIHLSTVFSHFGPPPFVVAVTVCFALLLSKSPWTWGTAAVLLVPKPELLGGIAMSSCCIFQFFFCHCEPKVHCFAQSALFCRVFVNLLYRVLP